MVVRCFICLIKHKFYRKSNTRFINFLLLVPSTILVIHYHFSYFKKILVLKMVLDPKSKDKAGALSSYRDMRFEGSLTEQERRLAKSTTLYIGNLSYFTSEEQVWELFHRAGDLRRIIMGLDRFNKTPCGFCFIEYYTREDAENALRYVNGTRLDDRVIRCDWDAGFKEGRQYGRGKHGGQVRDEYRQNFDVGRGGWNKTIQKRNDQFQQRSAGLF